MMGMSKVNIPWPSSRPGRYLVPCDSCGDSREVNADHARAIIRGRYQNICGSCSSSSRNGKRVYPPGDDMKGVQWSGDNFRSYLTAQNLRVFEIQCTSEHHRGERWKIVSRAAYERVKSGKTRGFCKSCAQKAAGTSAPIRRSKGLDQNELIPIKCGNPGCQNIRWLRRSTLVNYMSKGIVTKCRPCTNREATYTKSMRWQHPLATNLPCRPAPVNHRCHGLWESCERYNDCLVWAMENRWDGWVCSEPHDMTYCEVIDSAMIREAFGHSVNDGFLPDIAYANADSDSWLELGYGGSKPPRGGHHA